MGRKIYKKTNAQQVISNVKSKIKTPDQYHRRRSYCVFILNLGQLLHLVPVPQ